MTDFVREMLLGGLTFFSVLGNLLYTVDVATAEARPGAKRWYYAAGGVWFAFNVFLVAMILKSLGVFSLMP